MAKKNLSHLATLVFDTPLLIHRDKLSIILGVLGPRFDLDVDTFEETEASAVTRQQLTLPPEQPPGTARLALLPVVGTLVHRAMGLDALSGLTSYGMLAQQIQNLADDETVDAIVLDIDSPGGQVGGAFELADLIQEINDTVKPVYAIANDHAFSAAYLIACSAEKIFVTPTGNVGSIGVICTHLDVSEADKQDGLKYTFVYAGDYKTDWNPHEPLTDGALARAQDDIDQVYGLFTGYVAEARGLSQEQVVNTKAATFLGKSAVKAGLADEVMSATDAINAIALEVINMDKTDKQPAPAAPAPAAPAAAAPAAPVVTDPPAPAPVAAAPVPVTDTRNYSAEAAEISEACAAGGMPQLAAGFIRQKLTPAQAKAQLFDKKAAGEAPIVSAQADGGRVGKDGKPASEGEQLMTKAMERLNDNPSAVPLSAGSKVKLF